VVNVQPVSTPPKINAASVKVPPARYRYQLSRLIFRNRNTMMIPCIENILL
jgi:hypothetical protein